MLNSAKQTSVSTGSHISGLGANSKIEHVVIIVKENHCFDNYFGTFPGANGKVMPRSPNPPPHDYNHDHRAWLQRDKNAARQQFKEQDIPAYFAYARGFTLCDNYFTDVAGPSTPNHLMLIAADSPLIDNPSSHIQPGVGSPIFSLPSLPDILEKAKLTWGNYGGYAFNYIRNLKGKNKFKSEQFRIDARMGKIPSVSWVYATGEADEHPPYGRHTPNMGNVTYGMQWTVDQVNAIVKGGLWSDTIIFITWDDWGGWYDHVNPPEVEKWNDGTQFRFGSRVGCLVIGPYAKSNFISNKHHSHVSIVKFCESIFGLPSLNKYDEAADDMSDCFDFNRQASSSPKANP